jgi:hypothetical protein
MSVVDFADLQRISRLKSKAAVRRYLDTLKIRYRLGHDGAPWTTTEAINRMLLGPGPGYTAEPNLDACRRPRRGRTIAPGKPE